MIHREMHTHRILDKVQSGGPVSQRSLSRELGIALGLTNLLLRRMARKGWIRLSRIKSNRVKYLITPAGIAEKARASRAYFASRVAFYAEARDRIHGSLASLSEGWPAGGEPGLKRIVFYGAAEVAEIGYVCLAQTDFQLVAVIDRHRATPFFGVPVYPPDRIQGLSVAGEPFESLVVMSFDGEAVAKEIAELRLPPHRVYWI
jgi:hypothetical protein